MQRLNKIVDKIYLPEWLIAILIFVVILRIPSFFEPYSYGDEMIYLTLGQGIRQGIPLYSGLHDNKPPFLYIIAAVAGNLFWFKVILAFWNLATICLFWKLTKTLFPQKIRLYKIATLTFAILTTIPLLEGLVANAEIFMILPIIGAFYILFSKKLSEKNLILSGILFSLATLFKVPAAFDIGAILVFWLIASKKLKAKNFMTIFKNIFYLFLGFLIPIGLTVVWFGLKGTLKEYFVAAFLQNLGYLSSWRGGQSLSFWLKVKPLVIKGFAVIFGLGILYWKRKVLPKEFIFVTAWLLFALFGATLSERPYPHYLIQAVPAISLLLGILFTDKSLIQSIAVLPLALAFFVPFYYHFWHYPTLSYYTKFLKFATGQISKNVYFKTFAKDINRNYEIAQMIASLTNKKDRIFVWGDDAAIYALSKRLPPIKYVADYHINDYTSKEWVLKALNQNPPEMIICLPEGASFPGLKSFVKEKYLLLSLIEGAEVWKLIKL